MMQIKIDQEREKKEAEKRAAKEGKGKRKADDGEDEASRKKKAEEGRPGFGEVKVTDAEMGMFRLYVDAASTVTDTVLLFCRGISQDSRPTL